MAAAPVAFVVPGELGSLTGGYGYDRAIIAGLRAAGRSVEPVPLGNGFPWPDDASLADAAQRIAAIPDGRLVVADGLAFGVLPQLAEQHAVRLRWVALVHHPLALETGLEPARASRLFESERRALAAARAVIATSPATARLLADFGVAPDRVHVVVPGTAPAAPAETMRSTAAGLSLLCVGALIPRKGHALLLEALASLQDRAWTLHCAGSTERDAATTATVRAVIASHGLQQRVVLHGEIDDAMLQTLYRSADAMVLPTYFEGYGMALAEALAHGLPIVSTRAGAIPDTVPASAGLLVPPGDVAALRAALATLLDDPARRAALATGARAAGARLPGWPQAVAAFAAVLEGLR